MVKQMEIVKGVDHVGVDLIRVLNQKVISVVPTNLFLDHCHTECLAKDRICKNCGRKGYYVRWCRSQSSDSPSRNSSSESGHGRSRVRGNYQGQGRYQRNLDKVLEEYMATDTDDINAYVTVVSENVFRKTPNRPCLKPSNVVPNSPGGQLSNLGQFVARTSYKG